MESCFENLDGDCFGVGSFVADFVAEEVVVEVFENVNTAVIPDKEVADVVVAVVVVAVVVDGYELEVDLNIDESLVHMIDHNVVGVMQEYCIVVENVVDPY